MGSLIYLHLKYIYKLGLITILLFPIFLATALFLYYLVIFFISYFLKQGEHEHLGGGSRDRVSL